MQTCETCGKEYKNLGVHSKLAHNTSAMPVTPIIPSVPPIIPAITENDISTLVAKIEALEKKDSENQEKLKMLYEVADKGRVFNYENKNAGKPSMRVRLSVHDGRIVIGWRTIKDILVKHPTTGLTVGEEQEYELLLLNKDDSVEKLKIDGYQRFSDIRYTERIDAEIVGKKEDFNGNLTFEVKLDDGRLISLDARFIN